VDGGNTEVSGAFPEQVLTVQCHLSDIPRLLREPIETKENQLSGVIAYSITETHPTDNRSFFTLMYVEFSDVVSLPETTVAPINSHAISCPALFAKPSIAILRRCVWWTPPW
jgi:hypothetical protein